MKKPEKNAYPEFYETYVEKVPETGNILAELHNQMMDTIDLVTSLDDETLMGSYAPGKWSILEILVHLMDCERIFAYRALCLARGEKNPLPGFDENAYASNSKANSRKILNLVKEFSLLRSSTIELFQSFDEDMWNSTGIANGKPIQVKALAWIICGHEIHHRNSIEERYIGKI